mmetsp:Transcript_24170/g.58759  ORF Transcript_24170/g.58759 Transcript_24170/m.58759 type:complete len:232 (+) Transcript_24170:42-737(+)
MGNRCADVQKSLEEGCQADGSDSDSEESEEPEESEESGEPEEEFSSHDSDGTEDRGLIRGLRHTRQEQRRLKRELEATLERLRGAQEELNEKQREFAVCAEQHRNYREELKALEARTASLAHHDRNARSQLLLTHHAIAELTREKAELENEWSKLQFEIQDATVARDAICNSEDALEDTLKDVRRQLAKVKADRIALQGRYDVLSRRATELSDRDLTVRSRFSPSAIPGLA